MGKFRIPKGGRFNKNKILRKNEKQYLPSLNKIKKDDDLLIEYENEDNINYKSSGCEGGGIDIYLILESVIKEQTMAKYKETEILKVLGIIIKPNNVIELDHIKKKT